MEVCMCLCGLSVMVNIALGTETSNPSSNTERCCWCFTWQRHEPISSAASKQYGSARGVMVIVVGNGPGDTSSNPRRDW